MSKIFEKWEKIKFYGNFWKVIIFIKAKEQKKTTQKPE